MLRIKLQSDSEMPDMFKGLELLTNAAFVSLANIIIDESQNQITIPMERRSYKRERFLLFGERYRRISKELIDSKLVIKNVVDYRMDDNLHLSEIQLIFGVSVSDKEIYLCSAEESRGIPAFTMSIKVQTYDIELVDEKRKT
jgi:hypothetical protein